MNIFNFGLKGKIIALCLLATGLGALVVCYGVYSTKQVSEKYEHVSSINLPNSDALGGLLADQKDLFVLMLLWEKTGKPESMKSKIMGHIESYEKVDAWYQSIPFVDGEDALYQPVSRSWKEFKAEVEKSLAGNMDIEKLGKTHEDFGQNLEKLINFQGAEGQKWSSEARKNADNSFLLQMISLALLMICSFVMSLLFGKSIAAKVQSITTQLSENADSVLTASSQIAQSSQSLSEATNEQSAALQETASSLEEITSMIAKANESAQTTAASSVESERKATEGRAAVDQMLSSMEEISQSNEQIMSQIDESNRQMAEIVRVIQEIGTKTKVINDIVFQTKLLSFNASVEAARAGEHGKGFAVVAEEVGNLAAMSGNAAKEITDMLDSSISKVEQIANETKSKVESLVALGKSKVDSGVMTAKQCSDILNEIVQHVAQFSQLAQEISSASREQSEGVSEINKAMTQLDTVTQQNAATSTECAASAESLSGQAKSLRIAVEDLRATVGGERKSFAHMQSVFELREASSAKPASKKFAA